MSKFRLAGGILGGATHAEHHKENWRDEKLDEHRPHGRDVTHDAAEIVPEIHHVPKHEIVAHGLPVPQAWTLLHFFVHQPANKYHTKYVEHNQASKASNDRGLCIADAEPQHAGQKHRPMGCDHEGEDQTRAEVVDLLVNVVEPSGRGALSKANQEHDKIDVVVNDIQEHQACIGGVEKAGEKRHQNHAQGGDPLVNATQEYCITKTGQGGLEEGEGAVNAQAEQHEEEQTDPMDASGERAKDDGPATKNQTKPRDAKIVYRGVFEVGQVTERRKDGEPGNK